MKIGPLLSELCENESGVPFMRHEVYVSIQLGGQHLVQEKISRTLVKISSESFNCFQGIKPSPQPFLDVLLF